MQRSLFHTALLLVGVTVLAGCGASNRLAQYDFHDHTLAVVTHLPPRPSVATGGDFWVDTRDPVGSFFRAGSALVKEVQAERARARLDSAMYLVDIAGRVADRTLAHSARYLRARPVADDRAADYLLDVRVQEYGIVASSWHADAYFKVEADVLLIDAATGRRIWKGRVKEKDPITPALFAGRTVFNVVTADALARLSVDEMADALEQLADYAADGITQQLQRDLDRAMR